jgi:predicted nucleotidyltransferase
MQQISNQQLEIWSHAPSPTEMQKIQNTRDLIESALAKHFPIEQIKKEYHLHSFKYEIYLQGSYANHTNVRFDSDVDIVVQLNSVFVPRKNMLDEVQKNLYDSMHSDSLYHFKQFKKDVYLSLIKEFGDKTEWSDKCLNVLANGNRVSADVVPSFQYRIYKKFISHTNQEFVEGMRLFNTSDDSEIINYPKKHIENCQSKNTDTSGKFKDLVRIFKNMKNDLVEHNELGEKTASSYFIENLLYNCSSPCFDGSYTECMLKTLQFLLDAIDSGRVSGFVCANEQDSLINQKTWNINDAALFINKIGSYFLGNITI